MKFERLILNVSRTVEKSLLKFGAIYLNGAFAKSLDAFLSADASEIAPVVEELAATHGVGEVHLPAVLGVGVAHRRGTTPLGHDRVCLAE